jgi:hypothetical protein
MIFTIEKFLRRTYLQMPFRNKWVIIHLRLMEHASIKCISAERIKVSTENLEIKFRNNYKLNQ